MIGKNIHITGIVQGVGFRPFVYNLARHYHLGGWVKNTSAGVDIFISGTPNLIDQFIQSLYTNPPPLAMINSIESTVSDHQFLPDFSIIDSETIPNAFQPISPDVSICPNCLRELFNPKDRRFHYPFTNCTNCGPRFTIIQDIPYDRPNTTMHTFNLCNQCKEEYYDPNNRRFHAQPVACHDCGPHVWIETPNSNGRLIITGERDDAIIRAQTMLMDGRIIAIKGLGGFHLACDATNPDAVERLRNKKLRVDKPFAIMMESLDNVREHCDISEYETMVLISQKRPIVLLDKKMESNISPLVAPYQKQLGVMLPYTPIHYLLFANLTKINMVNFPALVMTSGNLSEEPIVFTNEDAQEHLHNIADGFLLHNRGIHTRCDDSVVRVFIQENPLNKDNINAGEQTKHIYHLRRSRGYAPFPILLPWDTKPILATGAELKNTFCLTRDQYAFVSHHIGDMENFETLQAFESSIKHYEKLFKIQPQIIACDLHPDYQSTKYAETRASQEQLNITYIQHHHAHIASCMADNMLSSKTPVIGFAFDGTGLGDDGNIWGGEVMLANYSQYKRLFHLEYMPLPGGDKAIRNPARIALAYLWKSGLNWKSDLPPTMVYSQNELRMLSNQLRNKINTHLTSSFGRLFDSIAAIIGLRQTINYEAQAAIELESICNPQISSAYSFGVYPDNFSLDGNANQIEVTTIIKQVLEDYYRGTSKEKIATKFHNGIIQLVISLATSIRNKTGVNDIVLSGGVWQNMFLLANTEHLLSDNGFTTYIHKNVPSNDGGISLGQAIIAHHQGNTTTD